MKSVNIGFIGIGGIGRTHFLNALRLKDCRVIAVADISKKWRNYARAHGINKVYDDYEKLLRDTSIEGVIISLPSFLHSKSAIAAAEHGKHVFIEKPLARNVEEGKEIVTQTQKAGVKVMVGYPLRFSKFAAFRKEIKNGHLGDIVTANAVNIGRGPFFARVSDEFVPSPVPSWWFDPKLVGGGALIDLGSHLINLLLWYFGDEITGVKCVLGHRFNMSFEDTALCLIRFKRGILTTVNVGWYTQEPFVKVELHGTIKTISDTPSRKQTKLGLLSQLGIPFMRSLTSADESEAFYDELAYFVHCVKNDRTPLPSAKEGLRDLEIIDQAYSNQIELKF